jgi:MFS family permease
MGRFLVGALAVWAALAAVNGFYSIQIVALGGDTSLVGLAWVAGALVEIPVMWSFPRLSARFGTGRLLVAGSLIFAVRNILAAFATNGAALVAISPLEGAAFGLFFVGGVGFVAARAPAGLAGTAQGIFSATTGLATILGTGAAGVIATAVTIPGLFIIAGAIGLLAAIVVAGAVRGTVVPADEALERAGLAGLLEPVLPIAPYPPDGVPFAPAEELQTWEIT